MSLYTDWLTGMSNPAPMSTHSTHSPHSTHSSHSLRFDELAIALPAHIEQAHLRQLAERLQDDLLAHTNGHCRPSYSLSNSQCTKHSSSFQNSKDIDKSSTARQQTEHAVQTHEIQIASTILTTLQNTPIADASVLVAITNEPRPRMLLTRRAGHLNSHAGQVSFAGGKHEPSGGNNIVTALREACEETALPPSQVQIVGQLPTQTSKAGLSVRPIVALVDPDVVYVPELGEIERIFWADFATLITQPTVDYLFPYSQNGQKAMVATPSWIIDNETVWGLTGRIIASLLGIGFDRDIEWYYRIEHTDA